MKSRVLGIVAVALMVVLTASTLPAQTDTLLRQNFEGSWLPTGWTQIINNTTVNGYPCTWYRGNYSNTQFHHGSYGAYIWWSNTAQNEWLISPPINLSAYSTATDLVTLIFSSAFYKTSGAGVYNYICVSRNNGVTWVDTVFELTKGYGGSGWTYINDYPNPLAYDINDHIGQTIRIGWNYRYTLTGVSRGVWSVDDVFVIAKDTTTGGGPGGDTLDLEMIQIVRPNTVEDAGAAFTPTCRIFNNLDSVVHPEVRCKIKDNETQQTVYEDVLHSFPLDPGPGYTIVSAFKSFTPEGGKTYDALFVLEHPNDGDVENNDATKRFTSTLGTDVTPTAIQAPAGNQTNPFAPRATYEEKTGVAITANLIYTIEDNAFKAVVGSDTMSHNFTGSDTYDATFDMLSDLDNGDYTITFWAEDPLTGVNISHDPMSLTFTYTGIAETPVTASYDLSVAGSKVNFSLGACANVSVKLYDAAGSLVSTLASGSYTAGSHSVSVGDLGSGVYFVKMFTPSYTGTAKVTVVK